MLPAMFYVLSGERSWQCCWNVMCWEIACNVRNNRGAGVMLREILWECLVIIACNVQSTVTSHIVRNVASILRAKSQVILPAKLQVILHVWRNAACKVENYASCNAMRNISGKVASDDTCLRRILRARLQILLPVKLWAILRAMLQVMSLVILLAILY